MANLTKKQLLAGSKRKVEKIEIEELGTVHVAEQSGAMFRAMGILMYDIVAGKPRDGHYMAKVCVTCITDSKGKPLFTISNWVKLEKEAEDLAKALSQDQLEKIGRKAISLNPRLGTETELSKDLQKKVSEIVEKVKEGVDVKEAIESVELDDVNNVDIEESKTEKK